MFLREPQLPKNNRKKKPYNRQHSRVPYMFMYNASGADVLEKSAFKLFIGAASERKYGG